MFNRLKPTKQKAGKCEIHEIGVKTVPAARHASLNPQLGGVQHDIIVVHVVPVAGCVGVKIFGTFVVEAFFVCFPLPVPGCGSQP